MMKEIFRKIEPFLPLGLFLFLMVDFYLIFIYAPEEVSQGMVQKIFYFHVSSAMSMYMGFMLAGLGALLYIWRRTPIFNSISHAGASVGLLFCSMVLASGPIWAKPIWGAWWTWDPRLTTTLILWLVFFSTILLRRFYGPDEKGRIYASILTLFGVLDIPLVVFAVKFWRGIHPSVIGKEDSMPFPMHVALGATSFTVLSLFALIYWARLRLLRLEEKWEVISQHLDERTV